MTSIGARPLGRVASALFVGLVVAIGALVAAPAAKGAGTDGWAVEPSGPSGPGKRAFFVYDMKAGQSLQDTVAVVNSSNQALTFKVYARDAVSTDQAGAVAFQQESEAPSDAGGWISLPIEQYTLPPGTRADISFTIAVPEGASPGDHIAGIVGALVNAEQPAPGASSVEIEQRIAARVYVRVEGPVTPALQIDDLRLTYDHGLFATPGSGAATVSYVVRNTGDVRLSPDVVVTLHDPLGRTVARSPAARVGEVLPGGSTDGAFTFDDVPATGRLTAEVTASTVGLNPTSATRSASQWAIPWLVVAPLVVLLVALGAWVVRRRVTRVAVSSR